MVAKLDTAARARRFSLLITLVHAAVAGSPASWAAKATAMASAEIVAPVGITNTANLSFGSFESGTTGTITVDTTGARSASGVRLAGGTPSAAAMTISGEPGLAYNISYSGTSANLVHGADTLGLTIVSDLGGAATSAGVPVTNGILGTGPSTLRIGGILGISNSGNQAGTYTGTIEVAVQYQ